MASALTDGGATSLGYSRSGLFGEDLCWLLSIEYAGRIWRWSTDPIDVEDGDGNLVRFDGGLSAMDFEEVLSIVGGGGDDRSVSLELLWPDPGVALLIRRGHDLAASIGELAILVVGEAYETRQVVVSGRLSQPEYGGIDEPVSVSLVEQPYDDLARLVPASHTITEDLWSSCPDSSKGKRYPLPFGLGNDFDVALRRPRSPAYALDDDGLGNASTLVIAGGLVASVEVSILTYIDGLPEVVAEIPVTYTEDGAGTTIATVDISAQSATFRAAGSWWVYAWDLGTPQGAIRSPFRAGGSVGTLGELMRYLAVRSSVRTDAGAFASVAPQLDWPVCGYVDDDVTPLQFLLDEVLKIAPVSLVSSSDGLRPVVWRYDARRDEAIETITEGPGVVRVSAVQYESKPSELVQRIELAWGLNAANRDFGEMTILEPPPPAADPRSTSNVYIRRAASRYADSDPRRYRTLAVESTLIYDAATAARVVHWLARKYCYSPRLVEYDVGSEYGWLDLGAIVIVVDDDVYLDDVALVVGRTISDSGMWRLTLQVLDGALSDEAVTPSLGQDETPTWTPGGN